MIPGGADVGSEEPGRRSVTLREAAALVFALAAILPTLFLVLLLSRAGLLRHAEARLGLAVAVAISVTGYLLLRRMLGQVAHVTRGLQASMAGQAPPASPAVAAGGTTGLTEVRELAELGATFHQMLDDLRAATERLEDLVFKLGTLNETVELAARVPSIQELLTLVLDNTMRVIRATIGSVMILDDDKGALRVVASRGLPEQAAGAEVRVGEGIAGQVVQFGEAVLVDNIETDPRFARPNAPAYGNGSFICLPIRARDRVIGVVNMAKRRAPGDGPSPQPFSPTDLQFLNTLMAHIGYSVDNARLLQEARQSAQNLQGVVDDLKATQAAVVRAETLRAIGQLSAGVAHHLNNLFTVILGRIDLLLRRVRDADTRRALEIVRRTALDGAEVVRRVQRFGHVEPVSLAVSVDLNGLAQEIVELTRPRWYDEAQLRGVRIDVVVEPGAVPAAAGEPAPLREVLMNLLLNAVDAMPQGGKITIRTWTAADRVYCAVSDTGVGMSAAVRRQALEPFFTTKGPRSMGLGLSVAYGTIQRYEGDLTIDSAEGRGTTITIALPAVKAAAAAPPEPAGPPRRPRSALRILVVDDELRVRTLVAEMLEARGHLTLQAVGGGEALRLLEDGETVDLVLTDLGMPDMTGWDVARIVRERWPEVPVGLMTGWGEHELAPEERSLVTFVLAKPLDFDQLDAALASVPVRAPSPAEGRV
jgi:signal transduction histidine kinase/CheY-like chemotaxis protein